MISNMSLEESIQEEHYSKLIAKQNLSISEIRYRNAKLKQKYSEKMRMTRNKPRIDIGLNGEDIYYIYFEDALCNLLITLYNNGIKPTTIPLEKISEYGISVATHLIKQGIQTYNVESIDQITGFIREDKEKRFSEYINADREFRIHHRDGKNEVLIGINDELDISKLEKEFRSNLPTEMQEAFMDEEINKKAVDAFKQDSYSLTLKPSKKNEQ